MVRFSHGKTEKKKSNVFCVACAYSLLESESFLVSGVPKSLNVNWHREQQEISLGFEPLEERMSLTDSPGVFVRAVDILSEAFSFLATALHASLV